MVSPQGRARVAWRSGVTSRRGKSRKYLISSRYLVRDNDNEQPGMFLARPTYVLHLRARCISSITYEIVNFGPIHRQSSPLLFTSRRRSNRLFRIRHPPLLTTSLPPSATVWSRSVGLPLFAPYYPQTASKAAWQRRGRKLAAFFNQAGEGTNTHLASGVPDRF